MWKSIKISQQTYFIYCEINDSKEEVTLVLYDLKETWYQTVSFKNVKLKVKVLNKRFDFDDNHIKEALTSGEFNFAAIEEQPHTSAIKQDNLLLKIKYGIKNCVLNYEWSLRRQSLLQFQTDFVQPLLVALLNCIQQVEILTECIRKKDAELHQYKIEGAKLNRRTLATKPFDFDSFNKKYEESNKIALDFKELAQYVLESKDSSVAKTTNDDIKLQSTKKDGNCNNQTNKSNRTELTPKKRKRMKELEQIHFERYLKIRKEGLQYENSESQSLSTENSQTLEENKIDVNKEKPLFEAVLNLKNTNNDAAKSQRNTRNSPIKRKCDNEAVVVTDSDSDSMIKMTKNGFGSDCYEETKQKDNSNLRSLRERKLMNSHKNSTLNSQNKSLNIFEFSIDNEEPKKFLHANQTKSTTPITARNLRQSPLPPAIDDLSLQLINIKKELESLEAMRLADLKKRSCKA